MPLERNRFLQTFASDIFQSVPQLVHKIQFQPFQHAPPLRRQPFPKIFAQQYRVRFLVRRTRKPQLLTISRFLSKNSQRRNYFLFDNRSPNAKFVRLFDGFVSLPVPRNFITSAAAIQTSRRVFKRPHSHNQTLFREHSQLNSFVRRKFPRRRFTCLLDF